MKLTLCYPLNSFSINQKFGPENTDPSLLAKYKSYGLKGHNGWDFGCIHGQEVYSEHDGVCVFAGLDGANGKLIVIRTDKPYDAPIGVEGYVTGSTPTPCYYKTLFGHLLDFAVGVGDTVKAGQLIAHADNTGDTTGDHVHDGLKPVYFNETDGQWFNVVQDNGFNGAIDPSSFWNGTLPQDIPAVIENLTQQVSILQMIINWIKGRQNTK